MKRIVVVVCLAAMLLSGVPCTAQNAVLPRKVDDLVGNVTMVTFRFERAELTPPQWGFNITSDRSGVYYEGPTDDSVPRADIKVSDATWRRLAGAFETVKANRCETKSKHIAQTGAKHIGYKFAIDPWAGCDFNYSDSNALEDAAGAFQAMAETIQFGERLQRVHRFDRLGLDAEVDFLATSVKEGRAIEVQNIAPALKSIQNDERVMERVRRKVARLLLDSAAAVGPAADGKR